MYGIKIYRGEIDGILESLVHKQITMTYYHTWNPYYRQAYERHADSLCVTAHNHIWASPIIEK
jgi:hypothetical protein